MSVSAHPWLGTLLGDAETAAPLGAEAQLTDLLRVEAAYARALGDAGRVPPEMAEAAAQAILAAPLDPDRLRARTAQDGVVVPGLVAQLKAHLPGALHPALHSGLTSQDVIDTALVLGLRRVNDLLALRLAALSQALHDLRRDHGATPLMGVTRMQDALPITAADRIDAWAMPLADHAARLTALRPHLERLSFGGPVGALPETDRPVAEALATRLGLPPPGKAWHAMRDGIAEYGGWLSLVTGTLGKMGQDLALMAQTGQVALAGGGASSAMPHKQNPVAAETLVTLARFNATLLSGLHQALVHEQERSGAAWALEWLLLPQMTEATGTALRTAADLARAVRRLGPA